MRGSTRYMLVRRIHVVKANYIKENKEDVIEYL